MARAVADIEQDIKALSAHERTELLQTLIADLDPPAESDVEAAWREEAERRLAEIENGTAQTFSGPEVIKEARARLR